MILSSFFFCNARFKPVFHLVRRNVYCEQPDKSDLSSLSHGTSSPPLSIQLDRCTFSCLVHPRFGRSSTAFPLPKSEFPGAHLCFFPSQPTLHIESFFSACPARFQTFLTTRFLFTSISLFSPPCRSHSLFSGYFAINPSLQTAPGPFPGDLSSAGNKYQPPLQIQGMVPDFFPQVPKFSP